jgi:CheY-like chemotaxis protein
MTDLQLEGARQLRVLVVDDCADIRDVFSCFIERTGHLTRTAGDGLEAVEILQRESFDVMLLDLGMPRMSGAEVARWLQQHPDVAPAMRVVAVTAWGQENMEALMEFGVTSVLPKPLPLQRLKALMTATLQDLELSQPVG